MMIEELNEVASVAEALELVLTEAVSGLTIVELG